MSKVHYNGPHSWESFANANHTSKTKYSSFHVGQRPSVDLAALMRQFDPSVYANEALDFFKAGCVEQMLDLTTNVMEFKQIFSTFSFLKSKSSIRKKVANAHLAYSFGISPLIADAKSLLESIVSVERKVAWLRKNQGKIVPVRYQVDVTDDFEVDGFVFSSDAGHVIRREVEGFRAHYTAFALMSYDTSSLSDAEIRCRNLIRAFGVDNPLGIIWENIPYSFVVDWFFSVGDVLNAIAPKIRMPYVIHDVGTSLKLTCQEIHKIEHGTDGGTGLPYVFERIDAKYYERRPGLKLSFGGLAARGDLSLNKLALALSLVVQKYSK